MLSIACEPCARRGRYNVERLIARHEAGPLGRPGKICSGRGTAFVNGTAIDELLRAGARAWSKAMTVLFFVALGFLAVLVYGSVALGVGIHLVIERLARKHDSGRDKLPPSLSSRRG
jgi:hypothetical protein